MGRNCEVCKEAQFMYKCPACLAPYCSVPCFKKHKELTPPSTNLVEKESFKSNVEVNLRSKKAIEVKEEGWIVSKERLTSLAECKEIRHALKSKELQKLLLRIDSSEEPEQELDNAMGGQSFHEFTEKILDIVNQKDG